MDAKNQKLEKFISKILQIQNQQKNQILKVKDLKEIASEMGMSDEEWEQISETFNAHALRGKAFLEYKNWTDAIKEFEQAHTLNPYNTDILYGLALSHKNLWTETRKTNHKDAALRYAGNCINIEPSYNDAIKLISEIKKPTISNKYQRAKSQNSSAQAKKNNKLAIILIITGLILGILFFLTLVKTGSDKEAYSDETVVQENSTGETADSYTPDMQVPASPKIKVFLVENEQSKGLKFKLHKVKVDDYDQSYNIAMKGYFALKGIEIDELKIKVDVLDKNNKVIHTEVERVIDESDQTVRSGDVVPIDFSEYAKQADMPEIKALRLSVNYITKEAGDFTYVESKKIPLQWEMEKPANFDLEVRERINTKSKQYNGGMYNKLVLEFKNTGNSTIKVLKIQAKWLDKKNTLAQTEEFYITIDSYSPIKRGQVRLYDRMFGINKLSVSDFGKYTISVLEVK